MFFSTALAGLNPASRSTAGTTLHQDERVFWAEINSYSFKRCERSGLSEREAVLSLKL